MRLARGSVSPVNGWSGVHDCEDSKQRVQQGQAQLQTRLGVLMLALVVLAVTASVALGYHLALHRVQLALSSQLGALHDASTASGSLRGARALLPVQTSALPAAATNSAGAHGMADATAEHAGNNAAAASSRLHAATVNNSSSASTDSVTGSQGTGGSSSSSSSSVLTALLQRPTAPVRFHPRVDQLLSDQRTLDYICYEPNSGLSTPVITIITIINLKPVYMDFVHTNRMAYAMKHGYRYCEQRHPDPARIAAFGRIPLTLAMAPCTDYLLHVDGDSLFLNHNASLAPLVAQMQRADVDLLVGRDIIPQSPFNFGVFLLRPADWHWNIFKKVYNYCACDWSRMHDWPAEQGILYDVLVEHSTQPWAKRWQAVSALNWNHLYPKWPHATGKELIVHLTNMPKPEPCEPGMHCKFKGVMQYWDTAVRSGKVANVTMPSPDAYTAAQNACQRIHFKPLVTKDNTYHEHGDRYPSSFLDYTPNGAGKYDLLLGELACLGWRDKKCKLQKYWNEQQGTGPLQELLKEEVVIEFFNADGSPKQ